MKTQLFVRTPTRNCDYEQISKPNILGKSGVIIQIVQNAYSSFSSQKDTRYQYIAINRAEYVLAGAWMNIGALVNEGAVKSMYRIRIRNSTMSEEYFAFVGFVFNKSDVVGKNVYIEENDFINAFHGIIEKIWDRDPCVDYTSIDAWYSIAECARENVNSSIYLDYINSNKKSYISVKEPTITIFNDIVNAMLCSEAIGEASFCSGIKNSKELEANPLFKIGCDYRQGYIPVGSNTFKKVWFEDFTEEDVSGDFCNNVEVNTNSSLKIIENKSGNGIIAITQASPSIKQKRGTADIKQSQEVAVESPPKKENSTIKVIKVKDNRRGVDMTDDKVEMHSVKDGLNISNSEVKKSTPNNRSKKKQNKRDKNVTKENGKSFFKKLIWFLTTDIRDLSKGEQHEDED